jgi:hypothetical protein
VCKRDHIPVNVVSVKGLYKRESTQASVVKRKHCDVKDEPLKKPVPQRESSLSL